MSLWFVALWATTAGATGLQVSPPYVVTEVPAGAALSRDLTLTSLARRRQSFSVTVADAWIEGGALQTAAPGTRPDSCADWITVQPPVVEVLPLRARPVAVEVQAPASAEGACMAALVIQGDPGERTSDGVAARAGSRLIIPVYANVAGTGTEAFEVSAVDVHPASAANPLLVDLVLRNTGTRHTLPVAQGILSRADGGLVGRLESRRAPTLAPGQTGHVMLEYRDELEPGPYEVTATVLTPGGVVLPVTHRFEVAPPAAPPGAP